MATLPQTHVFELSQQNSDSVKQNGEYTVHFAEPVTMQPGDQLSMRMASIDSQRSDSNSIILPLDGTNTETNISMRYSYYDINYPVHDAQKYEYDRVPTVGKIPDFLPYSAYDVQRRAEVESVVVTGRMIDDDRIGELPLQAKFTAIPIFTWVDLSGKHQHTPVGSNPVFPVPQQNDPYRYEGSAVIRLNDFTPTDISCVPTNKTIEFQQGTLTTTGFILTWNQIGMLPLLLRDNFDLKATNTADVPQGPIDMKFGTAGFTIDPGRYDRETLAVKLTQGFNLNGLDPKVYDIDGTNKNLFLSDTTLVINTQQPDNNGLIFHLMPTDNENIDLSASNSYVYADPDPATANLVPFVNIGARKLAIEYGQVGETFQLSAAHQSVDNSADPGNENVGFFSVHDGSDQKLYSVPRATGILIHDLEPRELWDDVMGLYNNVIVPLQQDASGLSYVFRNGLDKTPKESAEISVFTPKNNRGPNTVIPTPDKPVYINTTNTPTTAVIGNSPRVNQSGGYFLIEITGLNTAQSNFVDSETNRPNISAIVSTQYDNNDIVTGFADSAITYVHRGAPTAIASAKVRILDPLTKEVVPTLGEANSIFLDLLSQAPVYQPPQSRPSSDKDQKSKS